jgi:tRNA-2-methylthio-N6-dimethylallyladenosine synthase
VPVVLGCSHACAFCVIPYRRGAERSRPLPDILAEVRSLARQGVREVMLLGQIVDRYGTDFADGTDLGRLLRDVARVDGLYRVRFLTSHPNYMTDDLLETVAAEPKVCPQIEVALQAGHDTVLERMRRGYTVQQYRELVARIRRIVPGRRDPHRPHRRLPGETREQFMATCRLVEELRLDKIHLFQYSTRPKTIAARQMTDDVSGRRNQAGALAACIEDLQASILDDKNRALRGQHGGGAGGGTLQGPLARAHAARQGGVLR